MLNGNFSKNKKQHYIKDITILKINWRDTMMDLKAFFFFIIAFCVCLDDVFCQSKLGEDDGRCNNYDDACNLCIREPDCQWCSKSNSAKSTGHNCFSVNTDLSGVCDEIENPTNQYVRNVKETPLSGVNKNKDKNDPINNIVQITPQHIELKLRKGQPLNITLTYQQAKDYPLDLYYLMDLSKSMEEDKITLAKLGTKLATTMRNLTSQFRLGFGSFVDKVMLPFVNIHPVALKYPCANSKCATPFSFINNLKLIDDDKEFTEKVKAAEISSNLDSPEGGFDALMQTMVCEEEIGWQDNVRKIIIFSTDAHFHIAGDGKLAGVVTPNDGKCHLENGVYVKYNEFDYPSIGQIDEVAQTKGFNIIFAVKEHLALYKELSKRIKDSAYGELTSDSDNVVDLVAKVYNSISGKVEIGQRSSLHESPVSLRFFTDCDNSGSPKQINFCTGVREGQTFTFTVEVQVNECPKKGSRQTRLEIGTLQDIVLLDIELLCDCGCEKEEHSGYQVNSPACSGSGTKQCEVCSCYGGFYGNKCQCSRSSKASENEKSDPSKCRPTGANETDPVCSGRGKCECETCNCWNENYNGKFCQCNRAMCRQHMNLVAECSGHGRCDCNECACNPGYEGQFCQCKDMQSCLPKAGDKMCSGNGECHCGKCECKVSFTGKYCEECPSCGEGKCFEFRPCVQYEVWHSGEIKEEKACQNRSFGKIETLSDLSGPLRNWARLCTYVDENTGCEFNFTYKYAEKGYTVLAQSNQKCPEKVDILAITFGVICGIVAIGVLTLIIWKILTTYHDRREFERFENERKNAAWGTDQNPLYKGATTTVSNPAFSVK